jgi:hypothetical protein
MDKNVNNKCFCNELKKENGYQNVKHMHVNVFIYFAIIPNTRKINSVIRSKSCDFLKLIKDSSALQPNKKYTKC